MNFGTDTKCHFWLVRLLEIVWLVRKMVLLEIGTKKTNFFVKKTLKFYLYEHLFHFTSLRTTIFPHCMKYVQMKTSLISLGCISILTFYSSYLTQVVAIGFFNEADTLEFRSILIYSHSKRCLYTQSGQWAAA